MELSCSHSHEQPLSPASSKAQYGQISLLNTYLASSYVYWEVLWRDSLDDLYCYTVFTAEETSTAPKLTPCPCRRNADLSIMPVMFIYKLPHVHYVYTGQALLCSQRRDSTLCYSEWSSMSNINSYGQGECRPRAIKFYASTCSS